MRSADLDRLRNLIDPLTRFSYALMGAALLSVLLGAPQSALFFLVVGAAAYVFRASIEELAWQREARIARRPRRTARTAAPTAPEPPSKASERRRRLVRAG